MLIKINWSQAIQRNTQTHMHIRMLLLSVFCSKLLKIKLNRMSWFIKDVSIYMLTSMQTHMFSHICTHTHTQTVLFRIHDIKTVWWVDSSHMLLRQNPPLTLHQLLGALGVNDVLLIMSPRCKSHMNFGTSTGMHIHKPACTYTDCRLASPSALHR